MKKPLTVPKSFNTTHGKLTISSLRMPDDNLIVRPEIAKENHPLHFYLRQHNDQTCQNWHQQSMIRYKM